MAERRWTGGVATNTPIPHAVDLGAERIYVLPPPCPMNVLPTDVAHAEALSKQALLDGRASFGRPRRATAAHSHADASARERAGG